MFDVLPWNMIFNRKNTEETKILFLLYWYLFNHSDYPAHLLNEITLLENLCDLPEPLHQEGSITTYLHKMEEFNLISRVSYDERSQIFIPDTRKNPVYYQALPFFYLDPFCITTPHAVGGTIKDHVQEYSEKIKRLRLISKNKKQNNSEYSFIFNPHKNNTLLPAHLLIQAFSKPPPEVITYALQFSDNIVHCLTLYTLIRDAYVELKALISLSHTHMLSLTDKASADTFTVNHSFTILDTDAINEKILTSTENTLFLRSHIQSYEKKRYEQCMTILKDCTESIQNLQNVSQSDDTEPFIKEHCSRLIASYQEEIQKYREHLWKIIEEHVEHLLSHLLNEIHPLYIDVELGYKKFNPHTLQFE